MTGSESNSVDKANEYGLDSLKQIITLASGILALTITFIKDALGESRSDAILTFLVPISWLLLFACIPCSWLALVEAANTIASKTGAPYVFDQSSADPKVQKTLRFARRAQVSFMLGLFLLALFAIVNFPLFFKPTTLTSTGNTTPLP